ncbi:hypothetical protein DFH07DRAFT_967372 [Mycena maculata]|uniref:Uncharacterized protein n=1 Tax=Mycena maculata TaxID=230809 RepID=A0AAD7MWI6_9AGAR|nr:hypothetical protein DFH07DRAFT_967372 [Mycena maculata]
MASLLFIIFNQRVLIFASDIGPVTPPLAPGLPRDKGNAIPRLPNPFALFVSIAQSVFSNALAYGLAREVPGLDPHIVLNTGAISLKMAIAPQYLPAVSTVYNKSLASTFHIAIAMVTLSIFGALAMEWTDIRRKAPRA